MTLFKRKNQNLSRGAVTTSLLVIILAVTLIVPQIAHAEKLIFLNSTADRLSTPAIVGSISGFPVAGQRDPHRVMNVVATSYTSDPYQTDSTPCLPAMNYDLCAHAEEGVVDTIAANFLPLGTQVRFPELFGDKIFTVRDRMNARYNRTRRIDFYIAELDDDGNLDGVVSKQLARNFGVKSLVMHIF